VITGDGRRGEARHPRATQAVPTGADRPFRHRGFTLLWAARMLSVLGVQVQAIGVGWLIYALTGSVLNLGLVGLAQFLPTIGLALFTGHAADRWDRRRILVVCYAAESLCACALLALVAAGAAAAAPMLAILVALGAARAFENPATNALLPRLVPRAIAIYANALALNTSALQTATIVGPTLGGLLFVVGPRAVFGFGAAAFAAAAALALAIPAGARNGDRATMSWESLLAGLTFIRRRPEVLGALSLDLFAVLLGGSTALLPAYARDVLKVGPAGLGFLRSAPSVGALVTGVVLAYRPLRRGVGRTMFIAVVAFGAATIVFGLSRNFALSLAALAVAGAADTVSVVVRLMLVQLSTPDAMRGRVSGITSIFALSSNQIGEFESGVTAAWLGAIPSVVLGGIGTVIVAALWAWWFPALRRVDRLEVVPRGAAPAEPMTAGVVPASVEPDGA